MVKTRNLVVFVHVQAGGCNEIQDSKKINIKFVNQKNCKIRTNIQIVIYYNN